MQLEQEALKEEEEDNAEDYQQLGDDGVLYIHISLSCDNKLCDNEMSTMVISRPHPFL